jgi:hypothetical protein
MAHSPTKGPTPKFGNRHGPDRVNSLELHPVFKLSIDERHTVAHLAMNNFQIADYSKLLQSIGDSSVLHKTLSHKTLKSLRKTQVIVSTHSTHISSVAKIQSVNVLARRTDHAEVFQPTNGLDNARIGRVESYLDAVRSTLTVR